MKKTVLVSGGAGFIGSHVTVELIEAGYDVVVADNFSNCDLTCFEGVKKITGRDDIPLVEMDFCDAEAVKKIFADYPIDAVIHFAAFKAVGESVAKPLMYYQNNLLSFMNVLQAAQDKGGCNVLFSSSAAVYGEPEVVPVTEKTPRKPAMSPYGNTKTMCEDILPPLFQPHRRAPERPDRRAPARHPEQPGPVHHPDRHRKARMPQHLRQRLSHPGRHLPPRLH